MSEINHSVRNNRIENYYEMSLTFTEESLKNLLAVLMRGKVNILLKRFNTLASKCSKQEKEGKEIRLAPSLPSNFPRYFHIW